MSQIEAWEPAWDLLSERRGRGASGDAGVYAINDEYDDIAAVASVLADQHGGPIDVFGRSYGATCTLGAAARGAAVRRVVLYELPGPQTVPREWLKRASTMATDGRAGHAMFSFLTEIIGLGVEQVRGLADQPRSYDVRAIVAATLPGEGQALMAIDLLKDAPAAICRRSLEVPAAGAVWRAQTDAEGRADAEPVQVPWPRPSALSAVGRVDRVAVCLRRPSAPS